MKKPADSAHISTLKLDLYALGAMDEGSRRTIRNHLRRCPTCTRDRDSLDRLKSEFVGTVLPRTTAVLERRLAPARGRTRPNGR